MLLKLEWFEAREMEKREVLIDGVDILEKIENSETKNNEIVEAGVTVLRDEE